ncbi:hypothetical protein AB6B38_13355 [Glycocaulis abyssi]|uniref:DUF4234 domain-containing protein n=1 Tax=Glycocaulis abyssi TaxID=1433403 RepID=A0ABV9NC93_9PROT
MRFLLTVAVLFLLPFAGYYTWRGIRAAIAVRRSEGDETGTAADGLPPAPLQVLALVGAGLAITGILALALGGAFGGSGQTGQFHPPTLEDGRVVPGRIDPAEQRREAPPEEEQEPAGDGAHG